ncbi:hypothetical protein ACIBEJ_34400 [Nonomuraea sp. NPDC050790]|uniref:hypothetical protein n=1 Tax=Nonomuraea sp. NPDC050790 TaxID=3364371 RepID=UPI0037B2850F
MKRRDILDEIDDVITWHGSRDSMIWTAEPPKSFALAIPQIEAEQAQQAARTLGEQLQIFVREMTPAFEQAMRNLGETMQTVARIAPLMQELADVDRRARSAIKSEYARRRRRRTGRR